MIDIENFTRQYRQVNQTFNQKLVYRLGAASGFFSEFNNMVFSLLFCLKNGIYVELSSRDNNMAEKGWTGFFKPFLPENDQKWHRKYNHPWVSPRPNTFKSYLFNCYNLFLCYLNKVDFVTSDIFHQARTQQTSEMISIPGISLHCDFVTYCHYLTRMIYRFNDQTQHEINNIISKLSLKRPYVGLHIRRGDKGTETKFIDHSKYMSRVESTTDIRTIFVATDDFTIIKALEKEYSNWNIFTLEDETNKGNRQKEYDEMSYENKKKRLRRFLASVELLYNSDIFIGTYSSNVGLFLKMRRGDKQPTIAVDYDQFLIW